LDQDIFITQVARIMVEELHMPEDEAMNELAAIAHSDRLYETDVLWREEDQSGLGLDLTATFSLGAQQTCEWLLGAHGS
jgi:hypothetical protein